MTTDTPDPLTIPEAREDITHRDRAGRMSGALKAYSERRHWAFIAEKHGDKRSARGHRADARVCLHAFPSLLALVEPDPVMGEARRVDA